MNTMTMTGPDEIEVPHVDDVHAVTEDVWRSLFGDDETLPYRTGDLAFDHDHAWSAFVTITGEWQGVVTFEVGDGTARRLTTEMLGLDGEEEVGEGDISDAVGELVNVIGGCVKSMMPGPAALSLPAVATGRAVFGREVHEACRLDVSWRGEPVRICVHIPAE